MSTLKRPTDRYQDANLEAARIIAADPERYGGLPLAWAQATLARIELPPDDVECGPLFEGEAAQ